MAQEGFIKLHRCILDSSWSRQPDFVAVWVYCLLRANYNPADVVTRGGMIVHLEPGQFITSREQISIGTGVQESKVERILKVFKSEQQIEQQNKGKFRVISILNWNKYQAREQQIEHEMNNRRTTDEQQMNTNKKGKNGEEGKEGKEGKETNSSKNDALVPCEQFVSSYHELCPSLPKVRELTDKRRQMIKGWCRRYAKIEGGPQAALDLLLKKAEGSDFLTGKTGDWKAGFDWLFKEANTVKVMEGNYDNKGTQHGRSTATGSAAQAGRKAGIIEANAPDTNWLDA